MEPRHPTDPYPPASRTFRDDVRCLVLGLLVVVATPQTSDAAPMRGKADLKRYCTGDALSFCGGIDIDDPAMVVCFRKNQGRMSANCRRAVAAHQATQRR